MFEALQLTLIILLVSTSVALVCRRTVLYLRWRKEKATSRSRPR